MDGKVNSLGIVQDTKILAFCQMVYAQRIYPRE